MTEVSTDLNILITPTEWERALEGLPEALNAAGYEAKEIHMLVTQFSQMEGHPPIVEVLYRVVINGTSELELKELTKVVVAALPKGLYWYGSSYAGVTEPGVNAACAWQHRP